MAMGAKAAGAYLWKLRESKRPKMSRDAAAKELDTGRSQIERMEYGIGDTLAPVYMAFVRLVEGDWNEVADLLLSETATVDDGKAKAQERIKHRAEAVADRVPDTEKPDMLAFVRRLRADPAALAELRRLLNDDLDGAQ